MCALAMLLRFVTFLSCPFRSRSARAKDDMRHKKAFENLQLTERHIDSLKQSAAGAGGHEQRRGRLRCDGQGQLAGARSRSVLRHGTSDLPRSYNRPNRLFLPVWAAQLPAAGGIRRSSLYVQRSVQRRGRRHSRRHGRILPRPGCWSTAILPEPCKYYY